MIKSAPTEGCTFLYIYQSNRIALKWTILITKKMGCGRPPRRDTCIQNMIYTPFISMVVLTTKTQHYRKIFFTKIIIQGMLNIFYILSKKKSTFFSGRGVNPPPPP